MEASDSKTAEMRDLSHGKPASVVIGLHPIAVGADDAAAMLGISRATWDRLQSSGNLPAPVKLSERCPRWSVRVLEDWLAAGGPPRDQWESMQRERGDGNGSARDRRRG